MSRISAGNAPSKYYKFAFCDGLEALSARNHKTPFPSHFHPTYNITLIYDGVFNTKLHGRLLIAPTGAILITNPMEIHANPFQSDGSVSFFTFYISEDFLEYCNDGKPVRFNQNSVEDVALFAELHQIALKLNSNCAADLLENELRLALAKLAFRHGSDHIKMPQEAQLLFNELLATDYFVKFSLADAAKRFGIDKYKFIRLFKDQTGLTPNNYFIYKRIEQSKVMLAEGHDLLSIAIDLGFYDVAHYCNHFKKFTGVSPMAYTSAG
jgi:AraC-like DNA-binding protein